MVELAL